MKDKLHRLGFEQKCIGLILLFSIVVSLVATHGVSQGIIFFVFQLLVTVLSGKMIVQLLQLQPRNAIEHFTFVYFSGYVFEMAVYMLIVPLGLQSWAVLITTAALIILFVLMVKILHMNRRDVWEWLMKGDTKEEKHKSQLACFLILCGLFGLQLVVYVGNNLTPPAVKEGYLLPDVLYWIGNAVELTKHFPPYNFRDYPQPYNYHYFSSLQLAYVHLHTGITLQVLGFGFSIIQSILLCGLGAYCLFARVTKTLWCRVFAVLALFFASGQENETVNTYFAHLHADAFGFDYAMAFFCIFLILLLELYEDKTFSWKKTGLTWLFFLLLCGLKAPFGAIAIVGVGILCIIWLFQKQYKKSFVTGIPTLLLFGFAYLFITNIKGYSGGNISSVLHLTPMYNEVNDLFQELVFFNYHIPFKALAEIVFNLYYCVKCNPLVYILVFVMLIIQIVRRKLNGLSLSLLVMMLAGCFVNMYLFMYGASNMYFMMVTYPLGILFVVYNLNEMWVNRHWVVLVPVLGFVVLSLHSFIYDYAYSAHRYLYYGRMNLFHRDEMEYSPECGTYINDIEYEAYEYIRTHGKRETIITTNVADLERTVGVFTEGYMVETGVEGIMTNQDTTQIAYAQEQIEQMQVHYLIVYRQAHPQVDYGKILHAQECFVNDEIVIYEF